MRTTHNPSRSTAVAFTLVSAALFGLATPAVKLFIADAPAQLAAGVLYFGMGLGLGAAYLIRRGARPQLEPSELWWLVVSVVCGGMVAPWLIFWGLTHATATATSLLANTEVVFSTLIARFLFGERYSSRLFVGVALILGGAVALGAVGSHSVPWVPGMAVVTACAFWGIDNNAMRKVAHADANFVGCIKGLVAGSTNALLALAGGAHVSSWTALASIGLIGLICYGMSFGLYVRGLRVLGAARTSAYYATAPFAGAIAAITLLGEPWTVRLVPAVLLMGAGVWLHMSEPHPPLGPHTASTRHDEAALG